MNLYLDTSSLVKLYIREIGTEAVQALASQTRVVVATSWLTYAEARAAFARKHRDGDLTEDPYRQVIAAFEREWSKYLALEVSSDILLDAGQLAEKHGLKAADAVHLASALYITGRRWSLGPLTYSPADRPLPPMWLQSLVTSNPAGLTFSSADKRLLAAAQDVGLQVHDSR